MLATINRLLFTISTGYPYPENPMKDQIEYGKKVLDKVIEDDRFFLMCYELDEKDQWTDEGCWIKSNPLQATSELGLEFLRGECKMALELPSKQVAFRTKNLNQWLDGDDGQTYIAIEDFRKCKIDNYDWYGRDVYLGVDLSLTTDNTAVSMITYDEELNKYVAKVWGFIPTDNVFNKTKIEKVPYELYKEKGYVYFCGDRVISHRFVEDFVLGLESKYGVNIKKIGYDRYNAISSANRWTENSYDTIEVKQQASVLSPPTKYLKECVLKKDFSYIENKLLETNVANAIETQDTNLNGFVNKKKSTGKIDLLVATIIAMTLVYQEYVEGRMIYETDERPDGFLIF